MNADLHLCTGCKRPKSANPARDGNIQLFAETIAARFPEVTLSVRAFPCLGGCSNHGRMSLAMAGKWSWLFGAIDPERDVEPMVAFIGAWLASSDGLVEKPLRPPELRRKILGRLPPQDVAALRQGEPTGVNQVE